MLLLLEQGGLAFEAPAVPGQVAVLADDAMARDDDGDRVGGAGAGDGANGSGLADGAGDLGVRARGAVGDAAKFVPDAALERGGLHVERQVDMRFLAAQVAKDFADPLAKILRIAMNFRLRILVRESIFQARVGAGIGIAQIDGADAALRCSDQDPSERARNDCVMDEHAGASAAVGGGSHAHLRGRAFVEAAAGAVACVVHCGGHFVSFAKLRFQLRHALRVRELLRRDAESFLKQALHFVRAQMERAAEFVKRELFFRVRDECLFDAAANFEHLARRSASILRERRVL